jgi:hypothetical protein
MNRTYGVKSTRKNKSKTKQHTKRKSSDSFESELVRNHIETDSILVNKLVQIHNETYTSFISSKMLLESSIKPYLFRLLFTSHLDIDLPPKEWKYALSVSDTPVPLLHYGLVSTKEVSKNFSSLFSSYQYINQLQNQLQNQLKPHIPYQTITELINDMRNNGQYICHQEIEITHEDTVFRNSDIIMYMYYQVESQLVSRKVIVGILFGSFLQKDLHIGLLCSDGSIPWDNPWDNKSGNKVVGIDVYEKSVGTLLLDMCKKFVIIQPGLQQITLDSTISALPFYKTNQFILDYKKGNRFMFWRIPISLIMSVAKQNPTMIPELLEKWKVLENPNYKVPLMQIYQHKLHIDQLLSSIAHF